MIPRAVMWTPMAPRVVTRASMPWGQMREPAQGAGRAWVAQVERVARAAAALALQGQEVPAVRRAQAARQALAARRTVRRTRLRLMPILTSVLLMRASTPV